MRDLDGVRDRDRYMSGVFLGKYLSPGCLRLLGLHGL